MSHNSTGRMVREKIRAVLTDDTYGWNAQIAALVSSTDWEGIPPDDPLWYPIDFSDNRQFRETSILPENLEEGTIRFPFITVYSSSSTNENQGRSKGLHFTAVVTAVVNVILSWEASQPVNTELRGDLVEHLLINIFHRQSVWNNSVTFNGESAIERTAISTGAENWRQGIAASFVFQVDA
jgi:hypothetical protein